MKDVEHADVILGVKIIRTTKGFKLTLSHYVDEILDKFGKDNSRISRTPIKVGQILSKR